MTERIIVETEAERFRPLETVLGDMETLARLLYEAPYDPDFIMNSREVANVGKIMWLKDGDEILLRVMQTNAGPADHNAMKEINCQFKINDQRLELSESSPMFQIISYVDVDGEALHRRFDFTMTEAGFSYQANEVGRFRSLKQQDLQEFRDFSDSLVSGYREQWLDQS